MWRIQPIWHVGLHFKALESVNVKIWGPYPRNIPNSRPVSQAGLDFYELILDQFVQRGSLAARKRNMFLLFHFYLPSQYKLDVERNVFAVEVDLNHIRHN